MQRDNAQNTQFSIGLKEELVGLSRRSLLVLLCSIALCVNGFAVQNFC